MSNTPLKKAEIKEAPNVLLAKDRASLAFFTEQMASQKPFSMLGERSVNLLSHSTSEFQKSIHNLVSIKSPSAHVGATHKTLKETLYDATSEVKILTSQVAMYLDRNLRDRIFKQLDNLHDISEWDEDASPIKRESFKTFLKMIIALKPTKSPGLGLSDRGLLLAGWSIDKGILTTEFLPQDNIKWTLSVTMDGDVDRVVGTTNVARFLSRISPYEPEQWFYEKAPQKR